jgi:hypothetical protein
VRRPVEEVSKTMQQAALPALHRILATPTG